MEAERRMGLQWRAAGGLLGDVEAGEMSRAAQGLGGLGAGRHGTAGMVDNRHRQCTDGVGGKTSLRPADTRRDEARRSEAERRGGLFLSGVRARVRILAEKEKRQRSQPLWHEKETDRRVASGTRAARDGGEEAVMDVERSRSLWLWLWVWVWVSMLSYRSRRQAENGDGRDHVVY